MAQQLPTAQNKERNVVLKAYDHYLEEEFKFRSANRFVKYNDPAVLEHQQMTIENILERYKNNRHLNYGEKHAKNYLRHELKRIKAKLKPNLYKRLRYAAIVDKPLRFLQKKYYSDRAFNDMSANYLTSNAVDTNTAAIHAELADMGIKIQKETSLAGFLQHGPKEFAFHVYDLQNANVDYLVHVKRVPDTSAYTIDNVKVSVFNNPQEVRQHDVQPIQTMTFDRSSQVKFDAADMETLTKGQPLYKNIAGQEVFMLKNPDTTTEVRKIPFNLNDSINALPIVDYRDVSNKSELATQLAQGKSSQVYLSTPNGGVDTATLTLVHDKITDQMRLVAMDQNGKELPARGQNQQQTTVQTQSQAEQLSTARKMASQIKQATQSARQRPMIRHVRAGV
jgi:hypothetical protein